MGLRSLRATELIWRGCDILSGCLQHVGIRALRRVGLTSSTQLQICSTYLDARHFVSSTLRIIPVQMLFRCYLCNRLCARVRNAASLAGCKINLKSLELCFSCSLGNVLDIKRAPLPVNTAMLLLAYLIHCPVQWAMCHSPVSPDLHARPWQKIWSKPLALRNLWEGSQLAALKKLPILAVPVSLLLGQLQKLLLCKTGISLKLPRYLVPGVVLRLDDRRRCMDWLRWRQAIYILILAWQIPPQILVTWHHMLRVHRPLDPGRRWSRL